MVAYEFKKNCVAVKIMYVGPVFVRLRLCEIKQTSSNKYFLINNVAL